MEYLYDIYVSGKFQRKHETPACVFGPKSSNRQRCLLVPTGWVREFGGSRKRVILHGETKRLQDNAHVGTLGGESQR